MGSRLAVLLGVFLLGCLLLFISRHIEEWFQPRNGEGVPPLKYDPSRPPGKRWVWPEKEGEVHKD